ncbi:MAG: hypothetical protein SF162_20640 [bacterium]|nr:hypothetical protein [bacterium]
MAMPEPRLLPKREALANAPDIRTRRLWTGYQVSQADQRQIDAMIGKALLDPMFCESLLNRRTHALLAEFGFSHETTVWLCNLEVTSLTEFAQAVTSP